MKGPEYGVEDRTRFKVLQTHNFRTVSSTQLFGPTSIKGDGSCGGYRARFRPDVTCIVTSLLTRPVFSGLISADEERIGQGAINIAEWSTYIRLKSMKRGNGAIFRDHRAV